MSSSPLVSAAELAEHLDDPTWRSIDCRFDLKQPEAGEAGYHEGHIPGARNLPYQSNLDSRECCLPPEALKKMYRRVLDNVVPEHCIVMCGSGVTACQSLIALEPAGMSGTKLYAGSWSEWIRDTNRPVAEGWK